MNLKIFNNVSDILDKFKIAKVFKTADNPLLLVHRDMKSINSRSEKYDLIITPQLYMMKRDALPIKYSFQARKIAPSILDDFIDSDNVEYEVFKSGEEWVFLSYSKSELEDILISKGLRAENIGKVYFAQQFREQLEDKLLLMSQNEALTVINDIVTIVPRDFIDGRNIIFLENLQRPEDSFKLKLKRASKSAIDSNLALKGSIIMSLFGIGWWIDGVKSDMAYKSIDDKLSSKISDYPSLQSSITRKNILSKYSNIDTKQRAIRNFLRDVGKLISRDTKVISLKVDNKSAKAVLSIKNGALNRVKRKAKKANLNIDTKSSTTIIVKRAI